MSVFQLYKRSRKPFKCATVTRMFLAELSLYALTLFCQILSSQESRTELLMLNLAEGLKLKNAPNFAWCRGLIEEPVSFTCKGMRIAGMFHMPERTPAPGIIFCHGFTGTRIESHRLFVHAARYFCGRGFAVLRFDFRGSGESEGLFQNMTVTREIADLKTAVGLAQRRKEILKGKIGVNGLSLGGAVAILTAAMDSRIKVVPLWSTPSDLKGLGQSVLKSSRKSLEQRYVDEAGGYRVGRNFLIDLRKHNILKAFSKISPRPIFIIHGTQDQVVPLWHAEKLYEAAGEPKEKFFVKGSDHTYNRWDWQWTVIRHTAKWFEKNLSPQ